MPSKPDLSTTDVDYKGVVYGTQLATYFMRKNKVPGGRIVTTASVAAIYPHESYPEYSGAKAAVLQFVRATSRILKLVRISLSLLTAQPQLTVFRKITSLSIQYYQESYIPRSFHKQ